MKNIYALLLVLSVANLSFAEEKFGNLLNCPYLDMTQQNSFQGNTFLEFIKNQVKPRLDKFAVDGYSVASSEKLVKALDNVDSKVRRQVLSALKGNNNSQKLSSLKKIGDWYEGDKVTLYTLPDLLLDSNLAKDRFKLSTYIGLASCGGVTVKFADDNYAYNVHYGTGMKSKDKLTGRSFGASRIYRATDSSYSHYLRTLEDYVSKSPENIKFFTKTIMETLTNNEPRGYEQVNDYGDAVLTDFFAIWTAEQTRNLMDGFVSLHWDAALLQVTLLSAFHAGQDQIKLFYRDPGSDKLYFTNTTYKLAWPRKNHDKRECEVDLESRKLKKADLTDYIGVHYATYEHCGRSGINMSRDEWKKLSRNITRHAQQTEQGKVLLASIRNLIKDYVNLDEDEYGHSYPEYRHDVFRELARFLISQKAPSSFNKWKELSSVTSEFLEYVRTNAQNISDDLSKKYDSIK